MTRVLEAVPAPGQTIRFVDQVVRYAPDDMRFTYFSWKTALRGDYDVVHFHWPELLIRNPSFWGTQARRAAFAAWLARLSIRKTRIVRTVHNIAPHESGGRLERALLAALDRLTDEFVVLNAETPVKRKTTLIPHGDYKEQFDGYARESPVPGRVLSIGRIEPYKGIEHLLEVAADADRSLMSELRIVGRPSAAIRPSLDAAIARYQGGPTLTTHLAYVSDEDMVREISAAEAVILPYEEMHNSGILLVALSLARPVVVPDSSANAAIAREVGEGWVTRYTGNLTTSVLNDSLQRSRTALRDDSPDLDGRDWHTVADQYAAVFRGTRSR